MPPHRNPEAIRIGLVSEEPIRLEGLATIFDQPAAEGFAQLIPVPGSMDALLLDHSIDYLVVDLQSTTGGLQALEAIRRIRPGIRLIVIGPENDDELVLDAIVAGTRGYLNMREDPETVRRAIEVVTSGSIWAPRKLLSRLIDRLLNVNTPAAAMTTAGQQLTAREKQVLELILLARSNREIAAQLGIEERTVKAYVARLMRKTGADNRIKLSMSALNRALVPNRGERTEGAVEEPISGQ